MGDDWVVAVTRCKLLEGFLGVLGEAKLKAGRSLGMVDMMLGNLQQKDVETINPKLIRTLDIQIVEHACNAFLVNLLMGDIVRAMIDAEINTHRQDRSDFRMHICRFQMLKDIITSLGSSRRVTRSLSSSSSATGLKRLMGVKDSSTALSP